MDGMIDSGRPGPAARTAAPAEALAERLSGALVGGFEVAAVALGYRLGWYRVLADGAALTAGQLADRSGTDARYTREWLEHQAVCGYLAVDDVTAAPDERRYVLPAEHRRVLVDELDPSYAAPVAEMAAALIGTLPRLTEVYRGRATQSWADLGDRVRDAVAAVNRPFFLGPLVEQYLPALPGVDAALRAGGRVADLGCGYGWSAIGIASHWPTALVDGFDIDAPSLKQARANAAAYAVADRVRFHDDPATAQPGCYDLVAAFDCIHDQSDPVAMLATMRQLCRPGGTVLVVDEAAAERFTAPGDPTDQLLYGLSMLCCLPASRADGPSAATGTVMRPDTLRSYARAAGYADVESVPIHGDDYRCYRLVLA